MTKFEEDKLSIGQMAKLNNVTERSLRLYHENGLLVPAFIDESSSYRYYSSHQSKRLDMILQMKSVGLSLKQIKDVLDNHDLSIFEALLHEQIDAIETQISELTMNQTILRNKLNSCRHFSNPPSLNNVYVEYQPARSAFYFEIESYDYIDDAPDSVMHWKKALNVVKTKLHRCGMPITYFSDVGAIISQEHLTNGKLLCGAAFILADDKPYCSCLKQYKIQAGTYVCVYNRWQSGDSRIEAAGIKTLIQYIQDKGYTICGDYIAEVVAETTVFDYESHLSLVKMQIPISVVKATSK
jgi:DNA-binding transcriptional MerR regulator/effector-binding domain-containing protein